MVGDIRSTGWRAAIFLPNMLFSLPMLSRAEGMAYDSKSTQLCFEVTYLYKLKLIKGLVTNFSQTDRSQCCRKNKKICWVIVETVIQEWVADNLNTGEFGGTLSRKYEIILSIHFKAFVNIFLP